MTDSPQSARHGVLSGGNWIIDHVKIVDLFPAQDTLANILDEHGGSGGSPYNILIDLAKFGATFPLEAVGLIGDDQDGQTILKDCAKHGIDTSGLRVTTEAPTSYTDVMTVRDTGRRTFFHNRGANALLDESHFDLAASNARIFHLGYLLLLDKLDAIAPDGSTGASRLLQQASGLGFKTSVDLVSEDSDRFAAVVRPILPHLDYLIINEFEAGRSTGVQVTVDGKIDLARLSEAAARLLESGVREWVVIHFPDGALARHANGEICLQGSVKIPPEKIRGAAGAGDAFAAGTLLGLHDGWPIRDCLRMAVCAAASNLFDPTCTGGILPLEECLRLGTGHGFRDLTPAFVG
jgi:sugar/nucleoside kinase (ribokinase family)